MKLAEVSVRRPVFTTMMMLALLVFGIVAYPKVGVDLYPEVEFPVATISAVYPGADPETIESKVVDPIEEAVNSINGIEELRSTSAESVGIVTIQFNLDRDANLAVQDVRDKVSAIVGELPDDVEAPVVQKFDIGAAPIMSLVVSADREPRELTRLADDVVKQRLQTLEGVGSITVVGGQEREFQVEVDPYALDAFGLAVEDVGRAIGAQNVEIPGGRLTEGNTEFTIKTEGQVHDVDGLQEIILTSNGGRAVRLGDVASVSDSTEEKRTHSALDGKSAVSLTIQKQSGANTVAVAKAVTEEVEKLREELGAGVSIAIPVDNSTFIEHSINDVQFDLVFGAILAILIILLFLRDWRATFISALALPTSVIATVAFINVMGFTFNLMTMLALTLSIGILIDDAIVVIENIHRHLEMGKSPRQAALDGTSEIGLAVLAITASIVAVFVPVALMDGIVGRFFFQFGMTVAFAVSVSLFVAFTLTPMLSARMLKESHSEPTAIGRWLDKGFGALDAVYEKVIRGALAHPIVTALVAVVTFVGSLSLLTVIPFEFTPTEDRGEFRIYVEMPTGTDLDRTIAYTDALTNDIAAVSGVELTFTSIGGGLQGEVNKAEVHVELTEHKARAFTQDEAMQYVREMLADRTGAKFAVEPIANIGGGGGRQGDVQYLVMGADYDEINEVAGTLRDRMAELPGFVDVDVTARGGKPEIRVEIDRARAADLGVPVASIAMAIRTMYAGQDVTELATDGERFNTLLRMDEAFRTDANRMLQLKVRSQSGQLIPLSNVIRIERSSGPSTIERYDRQRQVTVIANLEDIALGTASEHVEQIAKDLRSPTVEVRAAGRADQLADTVGYMVEAMILAVVLIYLILAAQFESFVHPLTIMLSLPLSLIGALGALALTGMTLNIFTMIGFIMLMGLVTKNAVLLVDYTNVLRREGRDRFDALVEAGTVRLRPILMTTAAMIFGMLPVALALSVGGEGRAPMAVAVIGGLITSTILTLVVVPVAYQTFEKLLELVGLGSDEPQDIPEDGSLA